MRVKKLMSKSYNQSESKKKKKVKSVAAQLYSILCDPMTVAHQALRSMEFPRQEYWSGLSFPSPRDQTWVSHIADRFSTI